VLLDRLSTSWRALSWLADLGTVAGLNTFHRPA
jgi:hypothetical protein